MRNWMTMAAAMVALHAGAEPALYVSHQRVIHSDTRAGRVMLNHTTLKDDGQMKVQDQYHFPERREERTYAAATPEAPWLIPTSFSATANGREWTFDPDTLPPVRFGVEQFKCGVLRIPEPGGSRWAAYRGTLAFDNRADDRPWLYAIWLRSNEGEDREFKVPVPAGKLTTWRPDLSDGDQKATLWTFQSQTPFRQ